MYLYILLIGGIISIMKKQFLKGLLIKITSAVSATVLVFSAFAADTQAAAYNKVYSETDTTSTKAVWPDAPDVNSNSCILIDADTGSILFERNSHEKCYPASTTKILTGLLTIENCNMDDVVTFSQSAANSINVYEDANLSSKAGEQFTVNQLLHGLLLYSANEMAYALGEHVAGSIDAFVDMMNAKAKELGCTNTHFANPHGLQDENHYTTPYDIYLMLKEALNYPEFTQITQMGSYTVEYTHADGSSASTTLTATDHYLTGEATPPKNVTILGGKTGTTDNAGNCLALLSQNAYGKPYISIVMGASTKDELYQQMSSLLQNIN